MLRKYMHIELLKNGIFYHWEIRVELLRNETFYLCENYASYYQEIEPSFVAKSTRRIAGKWNSSYELQENSTKHRNCSAEKRSRENRAILENACSSLPEFSASTFHPRWIFHQTLTTIFSQLLPRLILIGVERASNTRFSYRVRTLAFLHEHYFSGIPAFSGILLLFIPYRSLTTN